MEHNNNNNMSTNNNNNDNTAGGTSGGIRDGRPERQRHVLRAGLDLGRGARSDIRNRGQGQSLSVDER